MADVQIQARLQGDAVDDNTVSLQMLATFATVFQKTVNQIAIALESDTGRDKKAIQKDTILRVSGTQQGSFALIMQPAIGNADDLPSKALQALVDGLLQIRESTMEIPEGYDQGVLILLSEMGRIFRKRVSSIEFRLRLPRSEQTVIYDYGVYTRVKELMDDAEEKPIALEGHLLSVNFKENKADQFKLYLFPADGTRIGCTFDEDLAESVKDALRHYVHVIGRAIMNPVTGNVAQLDIKQLTVLDLTERPTEDELRVSFDQYVDDHDTVAHFRESWIEAMTGRTHPISNLWDDIDAE